MMHRELHGFEEHNKTTGRGGCMDGLKEFPLVGHLNGVGAVKSSTVDLRRLVDQPTTNRHMAQTWGTKG